MRSMLIDIGLAILLATTILWFQLQPIAPLELQLNNVSGENQPLSESCIVLFWDMDTKSSHRDIQLIQRFHQAHPEIQQLFVHPNSQSENTLNMFLIELGVYTTPLYSEYWPDQIPTSILIHKEKRIDLNHSPHYSQLMEFFEVEF